MMVALSFTQPWAWLIVRPDVVDPDARLALRQGLDMKDIENRGWEHPPKLRGEFLIHAAKGMTKADYSEACLFAEKVAGAELAQRIPRPEDLERGGIVGVAELFGVLPIPRLCELPDGWRMAGQFGLRLRHQRPLPFLPCNGMQRWWGNFAIRDGKAVQL